MDGEVVAAIVIGAVAVAAIGVPLAVTRVELSVPIGPLAVLLTAAVLLLSANRV